MERGKLWWVRWLASLMLLIALLVAMSTNANAAVRRIDRAASAIASISPAGAGAAAPRFTQVALGGTDALATTQSGALYAWGGNAGSLCIGTASTIDKTLNTPVGIAVLRTRTTPALVKTPSGAHITGIAAGSNTSFALTSTGTVYAWGTGDPEADALGIGKNSGNPVLCPTRVHLPNGVKATQISASGDSALALTTAGSIYEWGEIPTGPNNNHISRPTPVLVTAPRGIRFTWVRADQDSFQALGSDGRMYAWGLNDLGQLDTGGYDEQSHANPELMGPPSGVAYSRASAGIAVNSTGAVFTWGVNNSGEIGNGTVSTCRSGDICPYVPTQQVEFPSNSAPMTDVESCLDSDFSLSSSGQVYAWGSNYFGQLGDGNESDPVSHPSLVKLPDGAQAVQISTSFNLESVVAVTASGRLYGWGDDSAGTVGGAFSYSAKGRSNYRPTPTEIG